MAPSGIALASWNAVPGDATYSWKTSLETVLLAVLPSDKLKSATNSKLTERRMGEVSKVLSGTHAREGLNNLSAQILSTKESLNKIDNAEDRAIAVALYIETLNEVNNQLETEQQSRSVGYLAPQQADTEQFSIKNLRRSTPVKTSGNSDLKNNNIDNTTSNPDTTTSQVVNYQAPTKTNPIATTQPAQQPVAKIGQPTINQPLQPTQNTIAQVEKSKTAQPLIEKETKEENLINNDVSVGIDETQEEINNIIEELENIVNEAEREAVDLRNGRAPQIEKDENKQQEQQREEQKQREEKQNQERKERDKKQSEGEEKRDREESGD